MSLEPLQAPAWIVALGTAFFFGAKAVMLVKGGNGHSFPAELRALLQQTTSTLAALTVRLEQLPTREELKDIAEKNRHGYRNDLQTSQGIVIERVDRTESVILQELRRPA